MTIEYLNGTQYANIYGLYDNSGKPIGTKEVTIAGRDAGNVSYYSVSKYSRTDVKRLFKAAERR